MIAPQTIERRAANMEHHLHRAQVRERVTVRAAEMRRETAEEIRDAIELATQGGK